MRVDGGDSEVKDMKSENIMSESSCPTIRSIREGKSLPSLERFSLKLRGGKHGI